jgi:Nickel responsive protein SCO4226-like
MQLYAIRRRNGWATADDLRAAAERSTAEGNKPGSGVRWIRSYVVSEDNGDLGTVCIYEAESPETIRAHAQRVGMPADEITPVADTVVVRPDPVPAAA